MGTPCHTPGIEAAKRIWLILLGMLVIAGCAPTQQATKPPPRPVATSTYSSTDAKFNEAQRLADQGETEKALAIYYSIALSHPDDPAQGRAWYEMGRLYTKKGYTHLAEERFKKVVKRYPASLWADASLLELAWLAHEKRDDSQAYAYLNRIETMKLTSLQLESYRKLREILSYQPVSQPTWEEEPQAPSNPIQRTEPYNATPQAEGAYTTTQQGLPSQETLPPEYLQRKTKENQESQPATGAAIGLWLPKDSSYPTLCQEVERGTRLAVEGTGLRIVESDSIEEILKTNDLVGIVGGMETFEIQKAVHLLEERSVPLITPFVRVPFLVGVSPMLFSTSYVLSQEARFLAETGRRMGLTTAGVLYPDIPFGRVMAEGFKSNWERLGGTTVLFKAYQEGTIDFTDVFDQMEKSNKVPQLLFLPCSWEEARLIIPQIAYHEFEGVTVMGVSLWAMTQHLYASEDYKTRVLFSNTFSKASLYLPVQEFIMKYLAEYKGYPSPLAAQAYDAALALVSWYNGGMEQPLSQVRFRGITGMVGFTATGEPMRRPFLIEIKQNGVVQLN